MNPLFICTKRHAEAIEELVRAAEGAAEKIKTCDYVMARSDLLVALAKLEKP